MEMNQTSNRIHPLMVGAAVSVMLVSLAGVAAITGLLPNSHGTAAPMASTAAPTQVAGDVAAAGDTSYQYAAPAHEVAAPVAHHNHKRVTNYAATDYSQVAPSAQYARTSSGSGSYPQPMQQPVQQPPQQPTPQHSTVGIATGAVIGGLLGNQVGGGNGRALATIAGAVGGGYLGDVVGKKSGY